MFGSQSSMLLIASFTNRRQRAIAIKGNAIKRNICFVQPNTKALNLESEKSELEFGRRTNEKIKRVCSERTSQRAQNGFTSHTLLRYESSIRSNSSPGHTKATPEIMISFSAKLCACAVNICDDVVERFVSRMCTRRDDVWCLLAAREPQRISVIA